MKILILMRHGEADDASDDFLRPLTPRGRQQCLDVGRQLSTRQLQPQRVICSSATRAHESARLVCETLGCDEPIQPLRELYLAAPQTYLKAVRQTDPSIGTLLLVAHNPGLSELAGQLLGRFVGLPAAGHVVQEVEDWSAL